MTPRFRDGIDVSGSRNDTLDPDFCDYGSAKAIVKHWKLETQVIELEKNSKSFDPLTPLTD